MLKRVLIIDDDLDTGEVIKAFFSEQGWETLLATNRDEGIVILTKHDVGLIVMDYLMSGVSAITFMTVAKKVCPNVKVVLVTAAQNAAQIGPMLGVDLCLPKPVDFLAVQSMLEDLGRQGAKVLDEPLKTE